MSKKFSIETIAVVLGASGGIGNAISKYLVKEKTFGDVIPVSRETNPKVDLKNEESIIELAEAVRSRNRELGLIVDATGLLHNGHVFPEKNLRSLTQETLLENFFVNSIIWLISLSFMPKSANIIALAR